MKPRPATGRTDEAALVARARQGETAAFELLYRMYAARVHALCWRLAGGDEARAQDLTQETFIRAWKKISRFRGEAALLTWLHRIAVNQFLAGKRRKLKLVSWEETGRPEPAAEDAADTARDLETALARLPERARLVFLLYAIEGYRHQEIAAMTGMKEGSSKAHLHRAKALLREVLKT